MLWGSSGILGVLTFQYNVIKSALFATEAVFVEYFFHVVHNL